MPSFHHANRSMTGAGKGGNKNRNGSQGRHRTTDKQHSDTEIRPACSPSKSRNTNTPIRKRAVCNLKQIVNNNHKSLETTPKGVVKNALHIMKFVLTRKLNPEHKAGWLCKQMIRRAYWRSLCGPDQNSQCPVDPNYLQAILLQCSFSGSISKPTAAIL